MRVNTRHINSTGGTSSKALFYNATEREGERERERERELKLKLENFILQEEKAGEWGERELERDRDRQTETDKQRA